MRIAIIIGAPRSGTNLLRDVLTSFDAIASWPCDEINYIWRHGNVGYPSDELPASLATPTVVAYLRGRFETQDRCFQTPILLEKTCANSLRVPFVDKVFPDAKYIYICRNGIDAAYSARARWAAPLDLPYILKKTKFVPKRDLPVYASRYLWSRIYRLFSRNKRLSSWGPRLHDMQSLLANQSLIEVCAIQWQRCVEAAETAFESIDDGRVHRLSYEAFVNSPSKELRKVLNFLECDLISPEQVDAAVRSVSTDSVGKGRRGLTIEQLCRVEGAIGQTLRDRRYA